LSKVHGNNQFATGKVRLEKNISKEQLADIVFSENTIATREDDILNTTISTCFDNVKELGVYVNDLLNFQPIKALNLSIQTSWSAISDSIIQLEWIT
jgi:DNA-binding XRE family transcriptional regulator